MSKHILDGKRTRSLTARSGQYARIELQNRPTPQSKAVQQRANSRHADSRANRFFAIERRRAN